MNAVFDFSESVIVTLSVSFVVALLISVIMKYGKGHEVARYILAVIFASISLGSAFVLWANCLNWPLWIGSMLLTGATILSRIWSANAKEEKKEAENK